MLNFPWPSQFFGWSNFMGHKIEYVFVDAVLKLHWFPSLSLSPSRCVCFASSTHSLCLMCEANASFSIFMWLKMKMSEHGCLQSISFHSPHNFRLWFLHIKWIIVIFNFTKSLTLFFSGYASFKASRRDWIRKISPLLDIESLCFKFVCFFFFWNLLRTKSKSVYEFPL